MTAIDVIMLDDEELSPSVSGQATCLHRTTLTLLYALVASVTRPP